MSDNFVLKNRAIHEIVTNNTPERQKLMLDLIWVEKIDWLNNEERTGILLRMNTYFFRQDEVCGQHAFYLTEKCHGI